MIRWSNIENLLIDVICYFSFKNDKNTELLIREQILVAAGAESTSTTTILNENILIVKILYFTNWAYI